MELRCRTGAYWSLLELTNWKIWRNKGCFFKLDNRSSRRFPFFIACLLKYSGWGPRSSRNLLWSPSVSAREKLHFSKGLIGSLLNRKEIWQPNVIRKFQAGMFLQDFQEMLRHSRACPLHLPSFQRWERDISLRVYLGARKQQGWTAMSWNWKCLKLPVSCSISVRKCVNICA